MVMERRFITVVQYMKRAGNSIRTQEEVLLNREAETLIREIGKQEYAMVEEFTSITTVQSFKENGNMGI